ncbi:MAG: hypothetical protein ACYST0_14420 [Planctomycetota bacterium]|jgi:hypothetical protein
MAPVTEEVLFQVGDSSRPIDHPMVDRIFLSFLGGRYYKESLN